MKTVTTGIAILLALALTGTAWAEKDKAEPQVRLELQLVDGSRIIGIPGIESVPVQTAYAKMDIALNQIMTIKITEDHETASVALRNGDNLKGVVTLGQVTLKALFGKVSIGLAQINEFRVVLVGGSAARDGLLLWNRLDAESDVVNSRVGPGGKLAGGRFVQGRFGKGIELNMAEQFGLTFPVDIMPTSAGCIEFWAKLVDFPEALPWGQRPCMLTILDEQNNPIPLLHFNGNDGVAGGTANGGLCAMLNGIGCAGTSQHGTWTYARALAGGDVNAWHHYALVWSTNALPKVDDGTRRMAVFVDGLLNSGSWRGTVPVTSPLILPTSGRIGLLFHQGMASGSVIFDNLKIWNYAKTDFGDRDSE